jgi:hypothetical protein
VLDCIVGLALCAPAWPWVTAALSRPQHVHWRSAPQHLDAVLLVVPLLLPWLLGLPSVSARERSFHRPLWGSILVTIGVLEAFRWVGAELVTARYLWPIIVPAAVLAGAAASKLRPKDLSVAVGAFVLITTAACVRTFVQTGSASGTGVEDWRSATMALLKQSGDPHLLVLYRSGFVEEDDTPLGSASPATRAAVRSPGRERPPWDLLSLTYRWGNPRRDEYFAEVIAPAIATRKEFALLSQHAVEAKGSYADHVIAWVNRTFHEQFTAEFVGKARGVDVVLFRRKVAAAGRALPDPERGGPASLS